MKEEIIKFGEKSSLTGILTYEEETNSKTNYCAIFLNAGLIHKIGPNRVYVKIAREIAEKGFHSFRFDYSGLGDSELSNQNKSLEEIKLAEIKLAMDLLMQKCKINKFILIGICSGAEDAFMASLEDQRIVGLSIIDGVYQDKKLLNSIFPIAERNCAIRYYKKHIFSIKRWMKIITGRSGAFSRKNLMFVAKTLSSFLKRKIRFKKEKSNNKKFKINHHTQVNFGINEWKKLINRKTKIYMVFCEGSTAIDIFNLTISKQLRSLTNKDLLKIEIIKDVDHTFTPLWSQELLIGKISKWIEQI